MAALIVRSARVGGEDVSAATPSPSRRIALALPLESGSGWASESVSVQCLGGLGGLGEDPPFPCQLAAKSLAKRALVYGSCQPGESHPARSSWGPLGPLRRRPPPFCRARHSHAALWDGPGGAPITSPANRAPASPPKCLSETPQLRPCLFLMATGPFRLGRYCSGSPWPFSCSCLSHLTQSSQIATTLSQRRPSPRNIENSDIG